MPLELNNPIELQSWTEYWKAKEIKQALTQEYSRSNSPYLFREIMELIKRIELFERKHKIG